MRYDSHVHLTTPELAPEHFRRFLSGRGLAERMPVLFSVDGLLAELDGADIAGAFVFPLNFDPEAIPAANDFIAAACRSHPDRLVGFCTVNPADPGGAVLELERMLAAGVRGLKLHPSFQRFDPADRALFPLYERAAALGVPVLIHTGASTVGFSDRLSRPIQLDDVAAAFPDLYLILAHGGRLWYEEAAMLMRKYPRVYADISANVARDGSPFVLRRLLRLVKAYCGGVDKLLFGSDYPVFMPLATRQLLEACVDAVPPADGPAITVEDVQTILDAPTKFARVTGLLR